MRFIDYFKVYFRDINSISAIKYSTGKSGAY